jgi:superfamily II DNA/RNA helicase
VFNYDAPFHPDDYVHRIGRTGRAGRSGHTYMLVSPRDEKYVDAIQKLTGNKIPARTLEGLAEATQARPPRDDHGGRDRNRGRNNNRDSRKGSHPVKPHGQVASMEPTQMVVAPAQPVAAQPAVQSAQQHPSPARYDHRQDHRAKQHQPKPQHQNQKPQRHQQEDDTRDARSQLPAFLLRPVKLPPAPEKAAPRTKKKDVVEP